MNREIKFRVWDKDRKQISEGVSLDWFLTGEPYDMEFSKNDESLPLNDFRVYLHDFEFMQYAGHNDKNGKEIYEGDVYHMGDPNITYTVVWRDSGLIGKQNSSSSYAGIEHWKEKIEVVGNIYESNDSKTP